jgi:hypothetical protein
MVISPEVADVLAAIIHRVCRARDLAAALLGANLGLSPGMAAGEPFS